MLEMILKPTLYGFDTCKEFAEAFRLNRDDLILSNAYIYEPYFGCMENLNCYVIFQEKYGAGEPTDVMVDAILADAAKYDAACTSSGLDRAGRPGGLRSTLAAGCCHSFSADGRCISLLKVLLTNRCVYDCAYCVNRRSSDVRRAAFTPRELAELTIGFYRRNYIEGLFLSSAVWGGPDRTTEAMIEALRLLREEYGFRGYIHAKAIPGADPLLTRRLGLLADGRHVAHTKAGDLQISVDGEVVWMDMAPPRWLGELTRVEWEPLYRAFGLTGADRPRDLTPQIVSTGLADIMMPVRDRETLLRARQNETLVAELSRRQKVTGVHMFCLGDKTCTAWCSNFAPLYDIPEECATGTSNGALTYYLYRYGLVQPDRKNVFIQGEHMRRSSEIRSRLTVEKGDALIRVGGRAVLSLSGEIYAD